MENTPIGSFVANFAAKKIKNITLKSNNSLLNALMVDPETGIIRTTNRLNGINETKIIIDLIGSNEEFSCKALLEIELIPVSKCLPNFDSNQQLIFNITVIFFN